MHADYYASLLGQSTVGENGLQIYDGGCNGNAKMG